MMDQGASELLQQLFIFDESSRIEAKTGSEIGRSTMETVCAYANEPGLGGGYLLFGIAPDRTRVERYRIEGVPEPDKLLSDLQTNCRVQFNRPVNTQESSADTQGLDSNTQGFLHEIQVLVDNLGSCPREQRLREVLLMLCEWRPLSPSELITLLPLKDASHLVRKHLTPMRQRDWLEYTIPEMPTHPGQKYRVTETGSAQLKTWRSQGGWEL